MPAEVAPYRIEFDEAEHRYTVDGIWRPSVTQVIKAERLADFDFIPTTQGDRAMDLGTKTHYAIELFDNEQLDESTVDENVRPRLEAWKKYRTDTGFEPELIEFRFYNPNGGYCGKMDRSGYYPDGSKAVVDVKNTDGQIQDWVGIQLAAYAMKLTTPYLYRRVAVRLGSDGRYQHREFPRGTFGEDAAAFMGALAVRNWKLKHTR